MSLATPADALTSGPGYSFEWALVDVETSGLRPGQHRVLSVALAVVGPDGRQTDSFATLLNPGCDPGPVHIHGLTRERLAGAPTFDQVADRIAGMLEGRVMVAHNAQFDYDFLASEFARLGRTLPVTRRLCTLALNRRIGPATEDLRLGTLAAHYGIEQLRPHDAEDDVRVLAGVLRASLAEAQRFGLGLPLVACPPRNTPAAAAPRSARATCAYRNPGRMRPGGPLVQGMKIVLTGESATPRTELVARAVGAGLHVMSAVSRHTSVLVTNDPESGTAKARRARAEGVPVIDEETFLRLLDDVRPGIPRPRQPAGTRAPAAPPAGEDPRRRIAVARDGDGPLGGRRVLVLGGTHEAAASARRRIAGLGGAAAVNLSASVTDVLLLPGGENDRRLARVTALALPVHDAAWLAGLDTTPSGPAAPAAPSGPAGPPPGPAPVVLPRGGVTDLPGGRWTLAVSWAQHTSCEVDVVAFLLDADEQVTRDEDFVFYGAPETPDGAVQLTTDGPTEQAVTADLSALPPATSRLVVAAAIDGTAAFGEVGAIELALVGGAQRQQAQATLDAATTERTLLLAEFYRRNAGWRLRILGLGYDHGLATLARDYGVDVEDD